MSAMRCLQVNIYRHRAYIFLAIIIASCLSIGLYAYNNRYNFHSNLDTISYLSIAAQYAEGYYVSAVDTYWSPMVSWLVALMLVVGLDGPTGFAAVNTAAAIAALLGGLHVISLMSSRNSVGRLFYVLIVTPFLMMTTREFTPDVLVIAWTVWFVVVLLKADSLLRGGYSVKRLLGVGVMLGVFGAVGYLIKLFLLLFFIGMIVVWALYRFMRAYLEKQHTLGYVANRSFIPSIFAVCFLVLFMAPWVCAVSLKYDQLVISTSFRQNASHKFIDTTLDSRESGEASKEVGFYPPYNEHSVSNAEGRPAHFGTRSGATLNTRTLKNFVIDRVLTLSSFLNTVVNTWIFIIPTLLISVAALFFRGMYRNRSFTYTSLSLVVYFSGYLVATTTSNSRYLWPLVIFGLMLTSFALGRVKSMATSVVFACVVIVSSLMYNNWPVWRLALNEATPRDEYFIAEHFKRTTDETFEGKKFAGNNRRDQFLLAYILDAQTYGSARNTDDYTSNDVMSLLERYEIDYFIHYVPVSDLSKESSNLPEGVIFLSSFELDRYTCRDVRYGVHGTGVPKEACRVSLYKIKP